MASVLTELPAESSFPSTVRGGWGGLQEAEGCRVVRCGLQKPNPRAPSAHGYVWEDER